MSVLLLGLDFCRGNQVSERRQFALWRIARDEPIEPLVHQCESLVAQSEFRPFMTLGVMRDRKHLVETQDGFACTADGQTIHEPLPVTRVPDALD